MDIFENLLWFLGRYEEPSDNILELFNCWSKQYPYALGEDDVDRALDTIRNYQNSLLEHRLKARCVMETLK